MTEPVRLTAEDFLPFAAYGARLRLGLGFLTPPAPDCPTCGEPITDILVRDPETFATDDVSLSIKPCGHTFTIPGEVVDETSRYAAETLKQAR